ncbi:MAG: ribbon-helix-helix domain-containing protein [Candidatus Nanohalobium sp.]|jgi:predicted DNA-binding protein
METLTVSVKEKTAKALRKMKQDTGVPISVYIRRNIESDIEEYFE